MAKSLRAVGIDLGTANSLMAVVALSGHTEMLRDREGKLHIPSVVLFDDERTIVGEEARLRGRSRPQRMAACAKQDLGQRFYSQPIGGQRLPPEVIQACILRKLKEEITDHLGSDFAAVIGVPAYFTDLQRRATVEAAEMADLRLLDVLNEPVAAALAFGEHADWLPPESGPAVGSHVLVYDLGGYTFEATLLRCEAESFTTVGTVRNNHLGGHDWDLRLADLIAEQFKSQHGIDLKAEPSSQDLLFALTNRAKLAIGVRSKTSVSAPQRGATRSVSITRQDFDRVTADLLERTAAHLERLLTNASLSWPEVSRVMLVGGATRMPMISKMLHERTGHMPLQHINPDEAVCRGAAIYAKHLIDLQAPADATPHMRITNISTHGLGIEGVDPRTGKKVNKLLIPRGTPLPAKVTKEFVTKANAQQSISITVLEGDSTQPQRCVTIGRAVLRELPAELTTAWPVEVTCEYDASGRLTVDARIRYTDRTVHLELLRPCGVSEKHLQRWKAAVCSSAGFSVIEELTRREREDEAPPPIAVAISPPENAAPEGLILSFLHRYMPFVFRGAEPEGSTSDDQ